MWSKDGTPYVRDVSTSDNAIRVAGTKPFLPGLPPPFPGPKPPSMPAHRSPTPTPISVIDPTPPPFPGPQEPSPSKFTESYPDLVEEPQKPQKPPPHPSAKPSPGPPPPPVITLPANYIPEELARFARMVKYRTPISAVCSSLHRDGYNMYKNESQLDSDLTDIGVALKNFIVAAAADWEGTKPRPPLPGPNGKVPCRVVDKHCLTHPTWKRADRAPKPPPLPRPKHCVTCKKEGHWRAQCPENKKKEKQEEENKKRQGKMEETYKAKHSDNDNSDDDDGF